MDAKRVVIAILAILVVCMIGIGSVSAQSDGEFGKDDAIRVVEKGTNATTDEVDRVVRWLTNEENRAKLSEAQQQRAKEFISKNKPTVEISFPALSDGSQSSQNPQNASHGDTFSQRVNESTVNKKKQLRAGQWVVETKFFQDNETGYVDVYSRYDGRIAVVDANYCDERKEQAICTPPVANARVGSGEVTRLWFHATEVDTNQQATLNSMTDPSGQYKLAIATLSNQKTPWYSEAATWTIFWHGVAGVIGGGVMGMLVALGFWLLVGKPDFADLYEEAGDKL
ncbi:hypothetical protein ACFQE1_02140 [Halobium palmae]|uniref:Uncharacterized protein n=1 Tax=Halobium palmae TaxID=1776492 RepID=A0ABD5RVG7_9EURY